MGYQNAPFVYFIHASVAGKPQSLQQQAGGRSRVGVWVQVRCGIQEQGAIIVLHTQEQKNYHRLGGATPSRGSFIVRFVFLAGRACMHPASVE